MNATTVVSTDLLTPLGAYLRLREAAAASFLLESVEHGRLGRHSFVGGGSRLVTIEEAETLGQPVVSPLRGAGGRWTISSELPIGNLAAGSYEVVATIALPGSPEQRLTRPFVVVQK